MELVIENCEEELSEWLWLEYRHAAEIWGGAIFTSARGMEKLREAGEVREVGFESICNPEGTLILDPRAPLQLRPQDFDGIEHVVVGGILGYAEARGRTIELITSRMPGAKARNLGARQLPIDGAALVARLVAMGLELDEIEIADGLEIDLDGEVITLPYGYVVLEGKVVVTPGLIEYLTR